MTESNTPATHAASGDPATPIDEPRSGDVTDLRSRTVNSSLWMFGAFGTQQVLRFGSNVVLSHLLYPEVFGLLALANVFLYAIRMASDLGIDAAIIQNGHGEERSFRNTAWTLQISRGVLLFVAALALSGPYGWFYGDTWLARIVQVIAISLLLDGFASTKIPVLQRRVLLSRIMRMDLACQSVGIGVMIVWAVAAPSPWALVAGTLVERGLRLGLSFVIVEGERDRIEFNREYVRQIYSFGKWIVLSSLITVFAARIDLLMLGKVLPIGLLGVYNIANMLASFPGQIAADLGRWIIYPVLAEIQRDSRERADQALNSARGVVLSASGVLVLGVALVSPPFFGFFYDERYQAAAAFCQLLVIPCWFTLLSYTAWPALLSVGDSKSVTLMNVFRLSACVPATLAGYYLAGVDGFIVGLGVGGLITQGVVEVRLARHGLHILRQDVMQTLTVGGLAAVGILGRAPFVSFTGLDFIPQLGDLVWAALVIAPLALSSGLRAIKTVRG